MLLPLAISLGTGESSILVALETLTISSPFHEVPFFQPRSCRRGFSDSWPEVSGRSFIRAAACEVVLVTWDPGGNTLRVASCRVDGLIALCLGRVRGAGSELRGSS